MTYLATGLATITSARSDFNTDVGAQHDPMGVTPTSLIVLNTGTKTAYVGSSTVTDLTGGNPGFVLAAGAALSVDNVGPNDCYAICASGDTTTLSWIYTRNA